MAFRTSACMPLVGASLLAKAVCQVMVVRLVHRYREQARSHRVLADFQIVGVNTRIGLPAAQACKSSIIWP